MKKLLSLTIAIVMLLASLCSCNGKTPSDNDGNIDDNDNNYNQNTNDISLSKGESFDLSKIVEAYKTSIKDGYMYKSMISCGSFGLVDFDGDGILEVALASDSDLDNYALYILRCEPGENKLISAGGYYIYKDSTVTWNAQAGTVYGKRELKSWETNEFTELWRIENDGEDSATYYINNLPVSGEEIGCYLDHDCDEKIEWYEFTEENINKYITVETFSDTSYFCSCPESKTDYEGYCDTIDLYKDLILYKSEGNDVLGFDASVYPNISSNTSSALKQIVFNNRHNLMGYSFKDINNDGTAELVLIDRDYNILALFTSVNKKALLLDTFGVNNPGAIDKDGKIYKGSYSKGETFCEKIMTLSASGELIEEVKYGCSDLIEGQAATYYKYVSGERVSISKAEIDELGLQYSPIFSNTAMVTTEAGFAFNEIMEFDPK